VRDLERRCEGARSLQLALFRVDGAVSRLLVGTSRPLRDAKRIEILFRERLAAPDTAIDAGFGFDLVRLSVLAAARFEIEQTDLGGNPSDDSEEVATLADRLCARLGPAAVRKTVPVQSHVPERAALTVAFGETRELTAAELPGLSAERPIRLFRHPEPVEVTAGVPEDPPANFRWRRSLYRVSRAEGPERIAPEWWRDEGGEIRDYFRVEDMDGRRYWLFREGLHQSSRQPPRWFMHGIFA
jgi:protein ImuB